MAGSVDGKGQSKPKETTPGESVQVTVRTDVPGGERSGAQTTGPNPGGKGKY